MAAKSAVLAAFAILTVLAALYFAWPIWRATLPLEIDVDEPWNAYHADAVRAGKPLYPDPDGLVANNYPPLSFYLIGGLSALFGDAVYVGRALSLLATASIALAIGCSVRQFGGSRLSAGLAGLWFLATLSRFVDRYVGMNDPHLLALAIMVWAMVWFVRCRQKNRGVEGAILLMVLAGFFKHTLFAIPIATLVWLALGDRRLALRAAIVGAGAAAVGLALCWMAYGGVFFRQLMMPRQYSLTQALASLGRLQWIAPALIVFAVWLWHRRRGGDCPNFRPSKNGAVPLNNKRVPLLRRSSAGLAPSSWHCLFQAVAHRGEKCGSSNGTADDGLRFTVIFVVTAFVLHFFQKMGAGVDDNAQFELAVAAAIGLGLAFDRLGAIPSVRRWGIDRSRFVVVLILIGRLLASDCTSPYLLVVSPEFRAGLERRAAAMDSKAAEIAAIPGPVVCPVMTVSRRAGKPFVFDAFAVDQRVKTGHLSPDELKLRLQAQGIRFESVVSDPQSNLVP